MNIENEINQLARYIRAGLMANNQILGVELQKSIEENSTAGFARVLKRSIEAGIKETHKETMAQIADLETLSRNAPMRRDQGLYLEDANRKSAALYDQCKAVRFYGFDYVMNELKEEMKK